MSEPAFQPEEPSPFYLYPIQGGAAELERSYDVVRQDLLESDHNISNVAIVFGEIGGRPHVELVVEPPMNAAETTRLRHLGMIASSIRLRAD